MNWRRLFSPCLFGHAEPIKAVRGKVLSLECSRCQQDLGKVLPRQKFKARKPVKVLKFRKQRSA